jgi:hypothetical protein
MGQASRPLRVLYIAGSARSGSTLLDLMLGQHPLFFSGGELREIWRKGVAENSYCGCRRRFHECPFWTAVGEEAFGGWRRLDLTQVLRLRTTLDRARAVPGLLRAGSVRRGHDRQIASYSDALRRLFEAIRSVSGAEVVADSSKTPAQALLLATIPAIDLRLVHLVRDSRGVAYSWRRGFRERAASDRRALRLSRMGAEGDPVEAGELLEPIAERSPRRRGVAGASLRWLLYNLVTPRLRRGGVPSITLRYESLVSEPRSSLARILELMEVPAEDTDLDYLDGHRLVLEPNHTVHGSNRLRFKTGELTLRLDEEWRREMRRTDRALATAMTFPLLLRYGYPLRATRPMRAAAP